MNGFDLMPFILSFKLAFTVTLLLFVICVPLALVITFSKFHGHALIESLLTLPMVLPPTVMGFYLLIAFSPRFPLGGFLDRTLGLRIAFSFTGIVIASCIHSLPFMIQPLKNGFLSLPPDIIEASYTLGRTRLETLVHVILPNSMAAIATGIIMTFVHVMGEFGVILMLGGSIPGVTRVASIALYESVEAMDYGVANRYAMVLVAISLCAVFLVSRFRQKGAA